MAASANAALHPAGGVGQQDPPAVGEIDQIEQRPQPAPASAQGNAVDRRDEREVALDRQMREEHRRLGLVAEAAPIVGGELNGVVAQDTHLAAVGSIHPGQDAQQGGLPAAAGAHQPDDRSSGNGQIDPAERDGSAERLHHAVDHDRMRGRRGRSNHHG